MFLPEMFIDLRPAETGRLTEHDLLPDGGSSLEALCESKILEWVSIKGGYISLG